MAKTYLLKYQLYEDLFNQLTGTNLEKLISIAKDYRLYKLKTGIDSPFESALMQTQQDNADFLGSMIINTIGEVVGIPDEVTHKGESLSTLGVRKDTKWTPTLTTPSKLYKDLFIEDDSEINHLLIGPFDTNGFKLVVPFGTTLTVM